MSLRANRPLVKYRWSGDHPTGLRYKGLRSLVGLLAVICALLFLAGAASAETVEVAPGVQVTKKTYSGPTNEQPFFGFVVKDAAQTGRGRKIRQGDAGGGGNAGEGF